MNKASWGKKEHFIGYSPSLRRAGTETEEDKDADSIARALVLCSASFSLGCRNGVAHWTGPFCINQEVRKCPPQASLSWTAQVLSSQKTVN